MLRILRPARLPGVIAWGLLLPPLAFLGWTVTGPRTLGNDFLHLTLPAPQTLRFYTGEGLEPMWYPHQTGGIPVGGMFYAQYYHWPAWLTSKLPAYWSGEALRLVAARYLLLLALAQATYYLAFRRAAALGRLASWLASLACVYTLRSLDAFRYGIALDAAVYAQAVFLFSMIHLVQPSKGLLLMIAFCTQLLLTASYPVLVPLVALAALLSVPALVSVFGGRSLVRCGSQAVLAAVVGALLAAPNWLAMSEWMSVNDARVAHPSLEWAAEWALLPGDLLSNLILPWEAEVHSAFGGSTLFSALLVGTLIALAREHGGAMLLALAFPFVYALGSLTPLFPFFFRHVPGFGMLRGPGRAAYMVPLLLFAAVVWLRGRKDGLASLSSSGRIAALAMAVASVLGLLKVAFAGSGTFLRYSPAGLTGWWTPGWQAVWLFLGLTVSLALYRIARDESRLATVIVSAATLAQMGMMMRHGTWVTERRASPARTAFQSANHLPLGARSPLLAMNALRRRSEGTATVAYTQFVVRARKQANCFLPIRPDQSHGVLLPLYLSDRLECVDSREAALERVRTDEDCLVTGRLRTLVVGSQCALGPGSDNRGLTRLNRMNRIVALTPNVTTLHVETPREAVMVTPYPDATSNWSGWMDGKPAPLLSINGGFLGLRVPPGPHEISIRYFSGRMLFAYRAAFATALALCVAGFVPLIAQVCRRKGSRVGAYLAVVVLAGVSLLAYRAWERRFEERARLELLMPNDYSVRLQKQLARWREASRHPR